MSETTRTLPSRVPFYYGWINLVMAAIAMIATLPGRSVGQSMIAESLLSDFSLSRVELGVMNFWATIIGATFALMAGPLIDRFGVRTVVAINLALLSVVVFGLTASASTIALLIMLILVRGFGQSALSVVSLTMVGKWFVKRLSTAMGIFAALFSIGFVIAVPLGISYVAANGWRPTWTIMAWLLAGAAVLSFLFVRRTPESCGIEPDEDPHSSADSDSEGIGFTLKGALRTPAFWVFAVGTALFNLVLAGITFYSESILQEAGFDYQVFQYAMGGFVFLGLIGNFLAGWLAQRWPLGRLMGIALAIVTICMFTFPLIGTEGQAIAQMSVFGFAGGMVAVIFSTSFGKLYGRPHLGKIQGLVQVFAVFASASGPWMFAKIFELNGAYDMAFYSMGPVIAVAALAAWWVSLPKPEDVLTLSPNAG